VTGWGDFRLPVGQVFTLGTFLKITEVAQKFGPPLSTGKSMYYTIFKKSLLSYI
jgi:hypothetical protein